MIQRVAGPVAWRGLHVVCVYRMLGPSMAIVGPSVLEVWTLKTLSIRGPGCLEYLSYEYLPAFVRILVLVCPKAGFVYESCSRRSNRCKWPRKKKDMLTFPSL